MYNVQGIYSKVAASSECAGLPQSNPALIGGNHGLCAMSDSPLDREAARALLAALVERKRVDGWLIGRESVDSAICYSPRGTVRVGYVVGDHETIRRVAMLSEVEGEPTVEGRRRIRERYGMPL